jgi:hypothetical protein
MICCRNAIIRTFERADAYDFTTFGIYATAFATTFSGPISCKPQQFLTAHYAGFLRFYNVYSINSPNYQFINISTAYPNSLFNEPNVIFSSISISFTFPISISSNLAGATY